LAVRFGAYQEALASGADDNTANAAADNFIQSAAGIAQINGTSSQLQQQTLTTALKNGTETVPTKFQTFEFGVKSSINDKVQFNTTLFYTRITDGVTGTSVSSVPVASATRPNQIVNEILYGNYTKGTNKGIESLIKVFPIEGMFWELAYTWLKTDWSYQRSNPDLRNLGVELDNASIIPDEPFSPEHIIRLRLNQKLKNSFNFNIQAIYASKYQSEIKYFHPAERYENIVEGMLSELDQSLGLSFENIGEATTISKNKDRVILNLRLEKSMLEEKLSVYAFGNDVTNSGRIANTDELRNVTISQIGSMYGIGLNYKFK